MTSTLSTSAQPPTPLVCLFFSPRILRNFTLLFNQAPVCIGLVCEALPIFAPCRSFFALRYGLVSRICSQFPLIHFSFISHFFALKKTVFVYFRVVAFLAVM